MGGKQDSATASFLGLAKVFDAFDRYARTQAPIGRPPAQGGFDEADAQRLEMLAQQLFAFSSAQFRQAAFEVGRGDGAAAVCQSASQPADEASAGELQAPRQERHQGERCHH